jgi:hypothetical protein
MTVHHSCFLADPFCLQNINADPYVLTRVNVECQKEKYRKIKMYNSKLILDSYEYQ